MTSDRETPKKNTSGGTDFRRLWHYVFNNRALEVCFGGNSGTPFSKSNAKNKIIISTLYEAPKMFSPPYCLFFTNVQRLLLLVKEIKTALLD